MNKFFMSMALAAAVGFACATVGVADLLEDNGNTNTSFEMSELAPWYVWDPDDGTNGFSVSTDYARTGSQSLKIDSSEKSGYYDIVDYAPAAPAIEYTASAFYYLPSALVNYEALGINMIFYDTDSNQIGPTHWTIAYGPEPGYPDETKVDQWVGICVTAAAPASTEWVGVGLQARGQGSTFHFDDVTLIPEPGVVGMLALSAAMFLVRRRIVRNRKSERILDSSKGCAP